MSKLVRLTILITLTLELTWPTPAETVGVLTGVIEDRTGAPLPNAEVKLINTAGGTELKTITEETGQFEFRNVPIGKYILSVESEGFQKKERPIEVGTTPAPPLKIRLEIAALTEQLTVRATPASADQNMDAVEINDDWIRTLPVKEGDLQAIGSIFLDSAATGSHGVSIVVDGIEGGNLDLPLASVKKIVVNRSPYSAEFSRPGRGRIEVVTKRGSRRRFHRNISLLFRNSAFDARNAFATIRPPMQRELFEGEFDGPLYREKATFLLDGSYFINNNRGIVTARTPAGRVMQNFPTPERRTRLFGRIDFQINPMHTLVGRYKFKNNSEQNKGVGGFNLPERSINSFKREHEFWISETAIVSANLSNDVRFSFKREHDAETSLVTRPAIIVLDAFRSGGAQVLKRQQETAVHIQDIVTWIKGKQTLRFGLTTKPRFFQIDNRSNFGGTFTFSSLLTFAEDRPFLFTINRGDPEVSFSQHEFSYFLQDEFRLRSNLSLSLGLRHEFQSRLGDYTSFAPRLGLAYSPGNRRSVFRIGSGVFYERQPAILLQQSLLYDGFHIRQAVVSNPRFPSPFDPSARLISPRPSVVRIAPDIRAPYLIQSSFGMERKLGKGKNVFALEYSTLRGTKLYRMRNLNAPFPGTRARPNPNFVNINQFESSGSSRNNSLRVTLQANLPRRFLIFSQYILSKTIDNTGGLFSLPANNYDLAGERGRADFDRRHQFNLAGVFRLPLRMRLGVMSSFSSGIPFNITTGFDDNHDTAAKARPFGIGRNTGQGPGFSNLDLRLSKRLDLGNNGNSQKLELHLDVFNVLNHVNFTNYIGTLTSPFFGRANSAHAARQVQISLKCNF